MDRWRRALARWLIGAPEEAPPFDDGSEPLTASTRLKGVRIERSRQFGDVYLALALCRSVGLGSEPRTAFRNAPILRAPERSRLKGGS